MVFSENLPEKAEILSSSNEKNKTRGC